MKQLIGSSQKIPWFSLRTFNSFKKPLADSLKHGFIVFLLILLLLSILELTLSIVNGKSVQFFTSGDIATAFIGFMLIFTGKFLEKVYGKR